MKLRPLRHSVFNLTLAIGTGLASIALVAQFATPQNSSGLAKEKFVTLIPAKFAAEETAPLPVTVSMDATKALPAELEKLRGIAESPQSTLARSSALDSTERTETDDTPDWFVWGRFASRQAGVTVRLPQDAPPETIQVYSSTAPAGASLLLENPTNRKLAVKLRLRLPAGVHWLERLSFLPPVGPHSETAASADTVAAAMPRLVNLQGCDFAASKVVEKPIYLRPGEYCLLRSTDTAREARAAFYALNRQLETLQRAAPGPSHRLKKMLQEGERSLGSLSAVGRHSDSRRRLNGIHHLLLVTAQAQSLHRNYLARHNVKKESGEEIALSLDRLSDALARTSSVLLGLIPQIEIEPAAQSPETHPAKITVTLLNVGSQSVDMVKLGLDSTALPPDVHYTPTDPAYFGDLRPGQSVQATFQWDAVRSNPVTASRVRADLSYFAASCPAHLRPQTW